MRAVVDIIRATHEVLPKVTLGAHTPCKELGAIERVAVDDGESIGRRMGNVRLLWLKNAHKKVVWSRNVAKIAVVYAPHTVVAREFRTSTATYSP